MKKGEMGKLLGANKNVNGKKLPRLHLCESPTIFNNRIRSGRAGGAAGGAAGVRENSVLEERHRRHGGAPPSSAELATAFKLFDSDGDGLLCKVEFAAYLRGIGEWGHGRYVARRWNAAWPGECASVGCTSAGVTSRAFEAVLYGRRRAHLLEGDQLTRAASLSLAIFDARGRRARCRSRSTRPTPRTSWRGATRPPS